MMTVLIIRLITLDKRLVC